VVLQVVALLAPPEAGRIGTDRFSWEEFWGSNCSTNDVSLSIFSVLVILLLLEETPLSFPFV
jgi:hypothetical protein